MGSLCKPPWPSAKAGMFQVPSGREKSTCKRTGSAETSVAANRIGGSCNRAFMGLEVQYPATTVKWAASGFEIRIHSRAASKSVQTDPLTRTERRVARSG
jgi:hypothetical protein